MLSELKSLLYAIAGLLIAYASTSAFYLQFVDHNFSLQG